MLSSTSIPENNHVVKVPRPNTVEDNLDLISKIVWKFARQYDLDFDDLFQEACIAAMKSLPKYNPEKAAFSTFMWITVTNALRDFVDKQFTYRNRHILTTEETMMEDLTDLCTEDDVLAQERLMELWAGLSPEAQEVCRMVISQETIYKPSVAGNYRRPVHLPTDKPFRCRMLLRQVLERQGWSTQRVSEVFKEIKVALGTT